ncbi:MAG TPA: peptidoglycan-binding domain-containing protein [Guyparkeria sp.]|nr:peptidoglycan-binding domain-containing protein [Guyparkeria sp.]
MTYFLAPSLVQLRTEVNDRWPTRSKISDGWIGDTAHSARVSDHNPDYTAPGSRKGVVRALDITTSGIDVDLLLKHTTNDFRVRYVIYNWRIFYPSSGWHRYTGPNGHQTHVHISIKKTATAESSEVLWFGSAAGPRPKPSTPSKATKPSKDPNNYTVRTESWLRTHLPRITEGTSKNSTPHLIGLYQIAQVAPHGLYHDQIWGQGTDQQYRRVHALQLELNRWKGTKIPVNKVFDKTTRDRVVEWQTRNMGGAYKGTRADGVVGPLTAGPLGIKPL